MNDHRVGAARCREKSRRDVRAHRTLLVEASNGPMHYITDRQRRRHADANCGCVDNALPPGWSCKEWHWANTVWVRMFLKTRATFARGGWRDKSILHRDAEYTKAMSKLEGRCRLPRSKCNQRSPKRRKLEHMNLDHDRAYLCILGSSSRRDR